MEQHFIDQKIDFDALREYVASNKYKSVLDTSPIISKLKLDPCPKVIEFQFEPHEQFNIRFIDKSIQSEVINWLQPYLPGYDVSRLIFGKDTTQHIVGCEVNGSSAELFIQDGDKIISKVVENNYWILSGYRHDASWQRLKGDQYYKYIKYYTDRNDWDSDKKQLYKYKPHIVFDTTESLMLTSGITYFKGLQVEDVGVLSFDIEGLGLHKDNDAAVLLISNTYKIKDKIVKKLFAYDEYESIGKMIDAWCTWVREVDPSVIVGHNVFNYDLPYLQHVAMLEGTELRLGRDGSSIKINDYQSQFRKDGTQTLPYYKAHIYGRDIVDTMFLSYKYDIGRKYESYGLKQIIKQEGLESKDRVFYDASQIKNNYKVTEEWKKIKAYCENDADDALNLYYLMIPSFFYYTQSTPKRFQEIICSATGGQLNGLLVRSYLQDGYSIPRASEAKQYEGAISFGNPGIYKNCVKLDYNSMYPSIIIQYELYDRFKDPQGNFLKIVNYFTKQRLADKQKFLETGEKIYSDLSDARKIVINSCYGLCGSGGTNNFNSPKIAEFITRKGREIIQFTLDWAVGKVKNGEKFRI